MRLPQPATCLPVSCESPAWSLFAAAARSCVQCLAAAILLCGAGCATEMLPAHDVDIPKVCADEIAVMKNRKYPPNSKEKYRAAVRLAKKIDFSYTKDFDFVASIFDPKDMRTDNPKGGIQMGIFYYYYGDSYVTFAFSLYGKKVTHTEVKIKE